MNTIYLVITSWDHYDSPYDNFEGFCYSEEDAKKFVIKLNDKYNIRFPFISNDIDEFTNEYNNIIYQFEDLYYQWEDYELKLYDEFCKENNISDDEKLSLKYFKRLNNTYNSLMLAKRAEWFINHKESSKFYIPKDKTWKDQLSQYDIWRDLQEDCYMGARYEKVKILDISNI